MSKKKKKKHLPKKHTAVNTENISAKESENVKPTAKHHKKGKSFNNKKPAAISAATLDLQLKPTNKSEDSNSESEKKKERVPHPLLQKIKAESFLLLKKGLKYVLVIVSVTVILVTIDIFSSERVTPGIALGSVDLGYKTPEKAKEILETEINSYLNKPIVFIHEDWEVKITPKELGIQLPIEQTVNYLPKIQFEKTNILNLASTFFKKERLAVPFSINNDQVIETVEQKLNISDAKPRNARFIFDKKKLAIEAEKEGKIIDRTKFLADLNDRLQNFSSSAITVNLKNQAPQITTAQLENKQGDIKELLSKTITLKHEGQSWKFPLQEYLDAISFSTQKFAVLKETNWTLPVSIEENAANPSPDVEILAEMKLALSPEKLNEFIETELVKNIDRPTSRVKISKNDKNHIVVDGKGENGRTVLKDRLVASLNHALNNKIYQVQIPVYEELAPVEITPELQDLGIKELLATGHSSYYGSSKNRMHNIDVAINKFNGILIAPGETFSFNKILGPVDGTTGYVPEKVIKQDKAEMEYGGGVCQVSSTAYRAALLAGLDIVERSPHSWKVAYYGQVLGHGLDATIYPGVKDFQFKNDTENYILMQAYAENANAYFKFYGTSDGRKVELDGPYGSGLSYTWYRNLTKNGETVKETIVSKYKPMPVATPAPSPAPAQPAPATTPPATPNATAANETPNQG